MSDSIGEPPGYDTLSSLDQVNTPCIETRITNDATTRNEDTSNLRHDPYSRDDTDSSAFAEVNFPTDQKDGPFQEETFSRDGGCNLQPNPFPNFSSS